jgi:hypothetical protein
VVLAVVVVLVVPLELLDLPMAELAVLAWLVQLQVHL